MAARELPPYTSGADPTCVSVIFCLMTRCRLLRRSEPRSRWCAEATRSSGGSVESSSPSQHLHGGVTVESKASVVVPPRLDTVDICTHTPEGCEVLGTSWQPKAVSNQHRFASLPVCERTGRLGPMTSPTTHGHRGAYMDASREDWGATSPGPPYYAEAYGSFCLAGFS